ncbi:MAG: macro domain-containing protein [Terriglobia bacterium]|jgi:O-acetyl-ADP-ribose deacetylase (regulator of RNase III)
MPTKIYISKGDITDIPVEAIVNPANTDLLMDSGVSAAIRRKGGERIQEECERLAPIRLGATVVTTAGNLKALFVIHAATIRPGEKATAESIKLATRQILFRAEEKTIKCLALPAIGTGAAGFPIEDCAQIMLKAVLEHIRIRTSLEKIHFVLYDDTALKAFEEAFQKLTARPQASAA